MGVERPGSLEALGRSRRRRGGDGAATPAHMEGALAAKAGSEGGASVATADGAVKERAVWESCPLAPCFAGRRAAPAPAREMDVESEAAVREPSWAAASLEASACMV